MVRPGLLAAALTGAFSAVFAVIVNPVTDLFGLWQLMLASVVSGAFGSLFAQTVTGCVRSPADQGRDAG